MNVSLIVNDITQIKSVSVTVQKNIVQKICIWNPATCGYKNGKYVWSIIDDSMIKCDEIIVQTKTVPTKSTLTKAILTKWTSTNFCILLVFLLITIALFVAASIYYYLIKYHAKQKYLPLKNILSKWKLSSN